MQFGGPATAKRLKDDYFDVNGKKYLLKMFLSEFLENAFMIEISFKYTYTMPLPMYTWFLLFVYAKLHLYLNIILEFAGDAR